MSFRCGPPKFDEQDFSQFDFTRWHLDGIQVDDVSSVLSGLAQSLFAAPEWRENFQTSLPQFQTQTAAFYQEHARQMEAQKSEIVKDYDARIAVAGDNAVALRASFDSAGNPPTVPVDLETFHLAVKVTTEDVRLGLPGLAVRLVDPNKSDEVIAQATTDIDGNTILSVPKDRAKELDKTDLTVQVIGADGKPIQRVDRGACVRLNQVETRGITLARSLVKDLQVAVLQRREVRQAQVAAAEGKAERLKQQRDALLEVTQCRLDEDQQIIRDFQPPDTKPPASSDTGQKS
jgi:hypothetical protein